MKVINRFRRKKGGAYRLYKTPMTVEAAKSLLGKTIRWFAPADYMNKPYTGIAKIISFNENNRKPFSAEIISGSNLCAAITDIGMVSFSDGGRFVYFDVIE